MREIDHECQIPCTLHILMKISEYIYILSLTFKYVHNCYRGLKLCVELVKSAVMMYCFI